MLCYQCGTGPLEDAQEGLCPECAEVVRIRVEQELIGLYLAKHPTARQLVLRLAQLGWDEPSLRLLMGIVERQN